MIVLKFENVSFIRDGNFILRDISFEIESGDRVVIFGKNGSGKSLLLQIIAGYLSPSRGEIYRFGERNGFSDIRELRKKIGFLGTFVRQHMHEKEITVDVVISGKYASIGMYRVAEREDCEKATEFLRLVNCENLANRFFGTLSDGEKQRILIARALMSDPELLLLDEPCANLDIKGREEFLEALEKIISFKKDITLIYVTHHTEEVLPIFDKIIILKNGKIFKSGDLSLLNEKDISEAFDIEVMLFEQIGRKWCIAKV